MERLEGSQTTESSFKGVLVEIGEEQIKADLVAMGFKINSVVRLSIERANQFDMVAVKSEKSEEGKKIFKVNRT